MSSSGTGDRASPRVAYALWMDTCARAGWRAGPVAEQVPVSDGLGRVTTAPVHARWPSPRADCAAMDGIAVTAAALSADGEARLPASAFEWIDTGDLMPAGADTVVERERISPLPDGDVLITDLTSIAGVTGLMPPGRNVRRAGEDIRYCSATSS